MDPLDPAKNDESSGFSKRRISSILKAPRKSIRLLDPEQQENVVECTKPVEKRNSRRVSFAPANNVLLFSNDIKNASPARSPLQDLMTTTATQNRVQVALIEDGIQQIAGMETLLSAPLHASQQRDQVNFKTGDDFEEKTVMFSTDDAFMDMTHSQTINIANNAELLADISLQNNDILPASRERTVMFTADNGSMDVNLNHNENMTSGSVSLPTSRNMDLNVERRNISSPGPCLDPGFENFLASLFKPSGPSINTSGLFSAERNHSLAQIKTQMAGVDKENQAPSSVPVLMEKSVITPRKIDQPSDRSVLCPKSDVSMDMTETEIGCVQGLAEYDNSFPMQEMYPHVDHQVSQTAEETKQQQSNGTMASFNPKDMTTLTNPSLHASHQRHEVNFDTKDGYRQKTIMFSAGDDFMDMTQSHTVNINSGSLPPPNQNCSYGQMYDASSVEREHEMCSLPESSANGLHLGFKDFFPNLSKKSAPSCNPGISRIVTPTAASSEKTDTNSYLSLLQTGVCSEKQSLNTTTSFGDSLNSAAISPENDVSMDMTEAQTRHIVDWEQDESLRRAETTSGKRNNEALQSNSAGMETLFNLALKTKVQGNQVKFGAEDDCRDKTVRFSDDDACMDVTQSHTVNIATDFPTHDMCTQKSCLKKVEMTLKKQQSDDVGSSIYKGMETSLTASSKPHMQGHQVNFDAEDDYREKTLRFTADKAANIVRDLEAHLLQHVHFVPAFREKTVRFSGNDAAMDVTQSHTVNIATGFDPKAPQNFDFLPACGENTVKFTANAAAMDVTQSHTVNITSGFNQEQQQNSDSSSCGEKTVRFSANDAAMDVTQSHTVYIAADFDPKAPQNFDFLPACGENTVNFTANAAAMDVTQSHTVNIASNSVTGRDSSILTTHKNMNLALSVKKRASEPCPDGNQSSSAHTLDQAFKNSLSKMSCPWANPMITKAVPVALSSNKAVDTNDVLDQLKTKMLKVVTESEAPGFLSAVRGNPLNQTMAYGSEDDGRMAMTQAQTNHIFEQKCRDGPPQSTSTQDLYSNSVNLGDTKVTSQKNNGSFNPDCEEITNRKGYLDSNATDNKEEPEPRDQTCSPNSVDHVDRVPSRKTRLMSFADLHTKIRRLSHMINVAPDTIATDSCAAPLPQLEHDMNKTQSLPEPELDENTAVKIEENTQAQYLMEGKQTAMATAACLNLKTKQLMSRLSVGGFRPKLPQRSKPDDPKKVNSVVEYTRTITVDDTNQLSNFDGDMSDIYAEELGSCEDISEMLDTRSPHKATEKVSPSHQVYAEGSLEDSVFEEDTISAVHGIESLLPMDENDMEDEKKASAEMAADFNMGSQSVVEADSNFTSAPGLTTQTTDESSSCHSASIRCEATFESTFKQSLFESLLEDYANDMQRKFDNGTITVLEFFKLFNIDFVIHNPRQSVLPERLLSDADRTLMDLFKDRHINRPKHMVYESNNLNLTEKVEGLKERMRDLDKPLKIVNRPVWEEMKNSSEKELKTFGAKLKERNNWFRKMSKIQSHEMKEVLYSNLVEANREEQQRLRGKIEESNEMIRSLDDCICKLETELAAVEEKGFEDAPSLKSRQEDMKKVTEALADNDRQISELEMQEKQNSKKLNRLKAETRNLESHITALHLVNEWKLGESRDNCTVYTFLHETLHLQLAFEKYSGTAADNKSERKISHIIFKHQIDEEKSQGHACLVHNLLSQYTEGESIWVKKYPTSRHVSKLLHDVGLLVSRCHLLGEELRLLKIWGGLKLDILDITCAETEVHVVFSSLKKLSKFEVIFSVSLTDHLYVLHVRSFTNIIGSTTVQQIKETVASFNPGKNLLTKIVKKIWENLLC